jgi:MinD-like ATPase involved in chromosome partitioning or flagellar assembly
MASCIAFHSYKGGTGKTTIAANLAALLAKKGYRVFLLDLDVYAPSLQAYFDTEPNKFINDFLNGTAEIRDVVVDLTPTLEGVYSGNNAAGRTSSSNSNSDINATTTTITTTSSNQKDIGKGKEKEKGKGKIAGKLWVGFCSSKKEEIYRLEGGGPGKQDSSKIQLLRRFILLREQLISLHDADYIIIDTSPGIRYWSINALAVADTLFLTLKMGDLDITGTRKMAEEIYGSFTKFGARSYLVMNRVAGYCVPQPLTISSLSPTGEHKNISQPNSSSFFASPSPHVSDTISRSATGGRGGGGGGEGSGTLASSGTHEGSITSTSSSSIMQQQKDESNVIASMLSSEVSMDVISAIACYCDVQFSNKEFLTALKYPDHPFAQQFEKLVQTIEAMQVNKAK